MKMHKKLFALLATAAVGLTLTSCGGGGGGGGAEAPSTGDDTVTLYGAPENVIGKTISYTIYDATLDSSLKYEFRFNSASSFTGTIYMDNQAVGIINDAEYEYERAGDAVAYLRGVVINDVSNAVALIDVDDILEGNYGTYTLNFDVQTGRLISIDGSDSCSMY